MFAKVFIQNLEYLFNCISIFIKIIMFLVVWLQRCIIE